MPLTPAVTTRDNAVLDRGETDVFLVDQKHAAGGLEQNFGSLRLLRLQHADQGFYLSDGMLLVSVLACAFCTDCATRFLSNGFSR